MDEGGAPPRTGEQPVRHDLAPHAADGVRLEDDTKGRAAAHIAAAFEKIRAAIVNDSPFGTRLEAEAAAEQARALVRVICAEEVAFLKAKNEAARSEWAEARAFVDAADASGELDRETMRSALGLICALRATLASRRSFSMLRARLAVPLALAVELEPPQPMHKMLLVIHRAGMDDYLESCQACFGRLLDVRAGHSDARRAHAQRAWERLRETFGESPPLTAVPPKNLDEWPEWGLLFATRFVYQRARLAVLDDLDVSSFRLATRAVQLERFLYICLNRDPKAMAETIPFANPVETAELVEGYLGDTSPDTMTVLLAALSNEHDAVTAPARHARDGADLLREAAKEYAARPETQNPDVLELLAALEYVLDSQADMLLDPERRGRVIHELLRARYPDLFEELPKGAAPPPPGILADAWGRLQAEFDFDAKLLDPEVFQHFLSVMGPAFVESDTPTLTKGFSKVAVMNVILVLQALISFGYRHVRYGQHLAVESRREAGSLAMRITGVAMVAGLLALNLNSLQLFYMNTVGLPEVRNPGIKYELTAEGAASLAGALFNRTVTYVPSIPAYLDVDRAATNTTVAVTLTGDHTLIIIPDYFALFPGAINGVPWDSNNSFLACQLATRPSITWDEVVDANGRVGSWYGGPRNTTIPAGGASPSLQLLACYLMNKNAGAASPPDPRELRVQYHVGLDMFTAWREVVDRGINWWDYMNRWSPPVVNAGIRAVTSYLDAAPKLFDDTMHMVSLVASVAGGSAQDLANLGSNNDGPFEYQNTTVTTVTETAFIETTNKTSENRGVRTFTKPVGGVQKGFALFKVTGAFLYHGGMLLYSFVANLAMLSASGISVGFFLSLPREWRDRLFSFAFQLFAKACSALGSRVRPIEGLVTESYGRAWWVREALQAAWFPAPALQYRSVRDYSKYVPALINFVVPAVALALLAAVPEAPDLASIYARHLVAQALARALTGFERSTPMTAADEALYEALLWNAGSFGYGPLFTTVAISGIRTLVDLMWQEPGPNARASNALVLSQSAALPAVNFVRSGLPIARRIGSAELDIQGFLDALRDSGFTRLMNFSSVSRVMQRLIEYSELIQSPDVLPPGAREPWISHFLKIAAPAVSADATLYKASRQYRDGQLMLTNPVRVLEQNMQPFIYAALSTSLSRALTMPRPLETNKAVLRYYYGPPHHIRDGGNDSFGSDSMPYANMTTFEDIVHYLTSKTVEKIEGTADGATPRTPPFTLVKRLNYTDFEQDIACIENAIRTDVCQFFKYPVLFLAGKTVPRVHIAVDWFTHFAAQRKKEDEASPLKLNPVEIEVERGELLPTSCRPALTRIAETLFGLHSAAVPEFVNHMSSRLQHTVFRTRVIRFFAGTNVRNLPLHSQLRPLAKRFSLQEEILNSDEYREKSFELRLTSPGKSTKRQGLGQSANRPDPAPQTPPPESAQVFSRFIADILWSAYEEWSWTTSHVYDRAAARETLKKELPKLQLMLPDFRCTFPWVHPDMQGTGLDAVFFYGPWYMVV